MNRLFLFDVDSTLINEEVIDLIGAKAGLSNEISAITEQAMLGKLDFNAALSKRVELLAGLPVEVLDEVRSDITFTNGAAELVAELQAAGDQVAVVSGGFMEVIAPVMKLLSIEFFKANSFEIKNNRLTGRVIGEIINRSAKARFLNDLRKKFNPQQTIAVGDGANDIDMIKAADIGIAFCAKPALKEVADVVIDQRDLREISNYL